MPTNVKANVLVVDDTPANLRLLSELLEDNGYEVRPIPNGPMALKAASAAWNSGSNCTLSEST